MHFQFVPLMLPFIASAVVTLTLGTYSFRQKDIKAALPFGLTMIVSAVWAAGYALELSGTDLASKLFAANIQATFYAFASVLWLIMVFRFIRHDLWMTRLNISLLMIIPVLYSIFAWTNTSHELIWNNVYLDNTGSFPILRTSHGFVFFVFIAYSYILNMVSEIFLIISLRRKSALFQQQSLALIIGLALLFVPNILFIFDIPPFNRYDLTPVFIGISGILFAWGIFRFKFLNIVPVARENIIENMTDGLIMLDAQNRLADMNPAAKAIFKGMPGRAIGQEYAVYFKDWPIIIEVCRDKPDKPREVVTDIGGLKKHYEVSGMPLKDKRGDNYGLSIIFHDVTEQKATQSRLIEQHEELAASDERERMARDLHDNLGQVFGFVNVQAQAIKRELSNAGIDIAARKIERLVEVAQSAHREMRVYIQNVKNTTRTGDLVPALQNEGELFQKQTGTDIRLDISGEPAIEALKPETKNHILHIIKEALNNIRKHARAKMVTIKIEASDNQILAIITDDGDGFNYSQLEENPLQGLGLGIMKERAEEIGGGLKINSAPGQGTKVTLNIPLKEEIK
jgi:signal transduction histidine kinase